MFIHAALNYLRRSGGILTNVVFDRRRLVAHAALIAKHVRRQDRVVLLLLLSSLQYAAKHVVHRLVFAVDSLNNTEVASKVAQIKLFYRILEHMAYNELSMLTILCCCCVSSELSPSDRP